MLIRGEIAGVMILGISVAVPLLRCQVPPPLPAGCDPKTGTTAEAQLRNPGGFAKTIVNPVYPEQSIKARHTGIVVAEVCVPAGHKSAQVITILTAPDKAMAEAVRKAIAQWQFGVMFEGNDPSHLLPYASKITYLFR